MIRILLIEYCCGIRLARQLCEKINFNLPPQDTAPVPGRHALVATKRALVGTGGIYDLFTSDSENNARLFGVDDGVADNLKRL